MSEQRHVVCFPSDGSGCGLYRMILPGKAVAATGKPVTVMTGSPKIAVDPAGNVKGINVGSAKIVVFQRPASYQIQQVINILHDNDVAVVIDMDDSLSKIHPRNISYKSYDPTKNHKRNWMHAARACEMADLVTVTTPALSEEYASHGRVEIIPNHIPASYLSIPRPENEVPIVGWTGWTITHPEDLTVTGGMINQVLIDTGAQFMAYGDKDIFTDLQIRNRPPHFQQGFTSIPDYAKTLVRFDIGLVPLKKSLFNSGKSWLKALEYASLGIVPVVSPTYDNMRLVEMGGAIAAHKPREWYDRVRELIEDDEYRNQMSKKCREVASSLTIEGNSHLWHNTWQKSYNNLNVVK